MTVIQAGTIRSNARLRPPGPSIIASPRRDDRRGSRASNGDREPRSSPGEPAVSRSRNLRARPGRARLHTGAGRRHPRPLSSLHDPSTGLRLGRYGLPPVHQPGISWPPHRASVGDSGATRRTSVDLPEPFGRQQQETTWAGRSARLRDRPGIAARYWYETRSSSTGTGARAAIPATAPSDDQVRARPSEAPQGSSRARDVPGRPGRTQSAAATRCDELEQRHRQPPVLITHRSVSHPTTRASRRRRA